MLRLTLTSGGDNANEHGLDMVIFTVITEGGLNLKKKFTTPNKRQT